MSSAYINYKYYKKVTLNKNKSAVKVAFSYDSILLCIYYFWKMLSINMSTLSIIEDNNNSNIHHTVEVYFLIPKLKI